MNKKAYYIYHMLPFYSLVKRICRTYETKTQRKNLSATVIRKIIYPESQKKNLTMKFDLLVNQMCIEDSKCVIYCGFSLVGFHSWDVWDVLVAAGADDVTFDLFIFISLELWPINSRPISLISRRATQSGSSRFTACSIYGSKQLSVGWSSPGSEDKQSSHSGSAFGLCLSLRQFFVDCDFFHEAFILHDHALHPVCCYFAVWFCLFTPDWYLAHFQLL